MRLTKHDETVAVYDRILRLLASIEITLDNEQRAMLHSWLTEEAARDPEDVCSLTLNLARQIVQAYIEDQP